MVTAVTVTAFCVRCRKSRKSPNVFKGFSAFIQILHLSTHQAFHLGIVGIANNGTIHDFLDNDIHH